MTHAANDWDNAITSYLGSRVAMNALSSATARNRKILLNEFARFAVANKIFEPAGTHKNLVIGYFAHKKISNNTKRVQFFILHAFFEFLREEEIVSENIISTINPPNGKKIESDYLDQAEVEAFFEGVACVSKNGMIDRNLCIAALMTALCLRVSEVCNLRVSDINMAQNTVRVRRKGGHEALLPLSDDLRDFLDKWLFVRSTWANQEDTPELFTTWTGKGLSVRSAQRIVQNGLKKAGLLKRKMGPHLLRHSGASNYLSAGIDIKTIQTILGHSNVATTGRYVHASRGQLETAVGNFKIPKSSVQSR
jgi:integrase/recombinase XerC